MKSFSYGLRVHWLECKITEIVEVIGCEPEEASQIAEEFFGTTRIPLRYTLYFKEYGYVTAAEVLSKGEKYDQQFVCNAFQYDHTRGHDETVFHWNDGDPVICRAADGRKLYNFANGCS